MDKTLFEQKLAALRAELDKEHILVIVAPNFNSEQMSCEFHKNNPFAGVISFVKGPLSLEPLCSGSLVCTLYPDDEDATRYNSDHDDKTFEEVFGVHTDEELEKLKNEDFVVSDNNWFEIEVINSRGDDDSVCVAMHDVIYSLEELLNAAYVSKIFDSCAEKFGVADEDLSIIAAEMTSVWDGESTAITTNCKVNLETKEVFDRESVDVEGVDSLDREYVTLPDGREFPLFEKDEAEDGDFWYEG